MKVNWVFLKWVILFALEGGSMALMSKDTKMDLKSSDDFKVIVQKMLESQEHNGVIMKMFFVVILVLVALQLVYLLLIATKRCLKKTVHRAVIEP